MITGKDKVKKTLKSLKSLKKKLTFLVFWTTMVTIFFLGSLLILFYVLSEHGNFSVKVLLVQVILLLLCPFFGSVLANVFSKNFIAPINEVIYATREVKNGNYGVRLDSGKVKGDVKELIESYNEMAEELGSIEILKNDFINVFSHEFKTPMVSIRGFAKQLKDPSLTSEQKKEYLDIIIAESERLTGMSSNILLLSKLESQQIITAKTEFALDEQISRTILLLEKEWSEKEIEFDLDLKNVNCINNEEMLSHVWLNILSNAIKFSPKNGKVDVSCEAVDGNAVVRISDSGQGMSSEVMSHIFEKFYQGDQSHASAGNGLGLSIAAKVVDLCMGKITARSEIGRGSVFVVEIPLGIS